MEPGRPLAIAIVAAAGSGVRVGASEPKAFLAIGGRPLVAVAVERALSSPAIGGVVVVAPPGLEERMRGALLGVAPQAEVVTGGATRQASVRSGLAAVAPDVEVIVVHDAARPFAGPGLFTEVVEAVTTGADAAIPVVPLTDTMKRVRDGVVVATEPHEGLALAQTPQAFRADLLRAAHARAADDGTEVTDDAALLERTGARVVVVPGDPGNFKITTALDLANADALLRALDG